MITLTPIARQALKEYLDEIGPQTNLRLTIRSHTPGIYQVGLNHEPDTKRGESDTLVDCEGFNIVLDAQSAVHAEGLKIDLLSGPGGAQLKFEFPSPHWDDPVADKVQKLIDSQINPSLESHGGYIQLLGVKHGIVEILMGGGCIGCPFSMMTLKEVIENTIKEHVPEVKAVVDLTQHYYQHNNPAPPPSGPLGK